MKKPSCKKCPFRKRLGGKPNQCTHPKHTGLYRNVSSYTYKSGHTVSKHPSYCPLLKTPQFEFVGSPIKQSTIDDALRPVIPGEDFEDFATPSPFYSAMPLLNTTEQVMVIDTAKEGLKRPVLIKFPDIFNRGLKYDQGKERMDLLPFDALMGVSRVLGFGAKKYAENSWRNVDVKRYEAAALRHYSAMQRGEKYDKESGLLHVEHFACNALFILALKLKEEKIC